MTIVDFTVIAAGVLALAGGMVLWRRARTLADGPLASLFDAMPAKLAKFDAQTRLVAWNRPYADFLARFGVAAKVGLTRETIIRSTVGEDVYEAVSVEMSRNPTWSGLGGVVEWPTIDGGWLRADIRGLGGGASLTILTDISEVKRTTSQLTEQRDHEKAANLAKSEFLANMSHEIRTPLNGVLGMVQVMARDELSPPQRERLEVVRQSGAALLSVLNDVLDISKIEAGKLEIAPVDFDAVQLGLDLVSLFEATATAKDLRLVYDPEPAAAGLWRGDALRIRQIVSNLLSNAVKFTALGEVRLTVACSEAGLAFSVRDTGIGIEAERIERLFDKFVQADKTTSQRYGGTGLGLSICRELASLMGGRIDVGSIADAGSTFRLVLPLERSAADPSECAETAGVLVFDATAAPLRVLAAEDNPTNQLVLRALLEALGLEATIVEDGRAAVQAFKTAAYDVVLMDMQMPVMNGVDASREIRAFEVARKAARTPIIALTANVMRHQTDAYLAAGMDDTVGKPIEIDALCDAINRAIGPRREATRAA